MQKFKFLSILMLVVMLATSCSLVDKIKQKLSSKKETEEKKETTTENKEETKEVTSGADLEFYNKYIEVSNKIQEAGNGVYKDYINEVPDPKSVSKNSLIIAVSFSLSADNLE